MDEVISFETIRHLAPERFWEKVFIPDNPEECWQWMATTNNIGYGHFRYNGPQWVAHKFLYVAIHGPLGEGVELDHVASKGCKYRHCVNPNHLEPVSHVENVRRGRGGQNNALKTRCPQGHPYDELNTLWTKRKGKEAHVPNRMCKTCLRERSRAYYSRKRKSRAENGDTDE